MDTPLEFIRLEDSCEVVPWLEKRYAPVPQESDGTALRMVMHHLGIGVAASELERLIKAVFDERAQEKRLERAHQLAEERQKAEFYIAAERAKAESAALTLRETRRTAVVESRVDKVKRDDEMKLQTEWTGLFLYISLSICLCVYLSLYICIFVTLCLAI